jgi:uncharacterized membrane protein
MSAMLSLAVLLAIAGWKLWSADTKYPWLYSIASLVSYGFSSYLFFYLLKAEL